MATPKSPGLVVIAAGGKGGSGPSTVTVPLAALAVDGTNPETGDPVTFTVEGTVQDVQGDNAVVQVTKINDQDASSPDASSQDDGDDDEASLQANATAADAEDYS